MAGMDKKWWETVGRKPRMSLKHPGDRSAVNAGSILTSAIAPWHCTCILSLARMHCVGILAAWTTAAPVLAPTLPIHPMARLSTFGIAKRTKVLIQDRCRRQASRKGAVLGQGVQTGFKIGGCCKTGGTRQGGCRLTDPLSCAKIGAVVKKKVGRNGSAQRNHLYIWANFTCLSAQKPQEHAQVRGMGCQKMCCDRGAVGFILFGYTSLPLPASTLPISFLAAGQGYSTRNWVYIYVSSPPLHGAMFPTPPSPLCVLPAALGTFWCVCWRGEVGAPLGCSRAGRAVGRGAPQIVPPRAPPQSTLLPPPPFPFLDPPPPTPGAPTAILP